MTLRLNSVLKIPVANVYRLITPKIHPGHSRCVASYSFQLCMVCGSNFWIKVKSASETVYETLNLAESYKTINHYQQGS